MFLLVFPDNDRDLSFKDCVLSRAIKLESGAKPFVPFLPLDFYYYSLKKREDLYSSKLSDEAYLIYYSPETESFLYERYSGCDDIFDIYACTLNKDYRLPQPLNFEKVLPGGIHDISFYPKGFNCFLFNGTISGKYEQDKDQYVFKYSMPDPRYDSKHPNPMFLDPVSYDNPHSFWLNFYKHFGDFNIYDFKKLIKKNTLEVHPFDDSSFDMFNENPILRKILFRDNKYPVGYIRYRGYSFFSKGDDLDERKLVKLPNKIKPGGEKITAFLFMDLRISLGGEHLNYSWENAPYENPYALGDLWNLKLGTDMILYNPILKEAALIDGWEKRFYVFKLD